MPEDRLDMIERLTAMRDAGTLTEAEFAAEKARLLGGRRWGRIGLITLAVLALAAGGGWAVRQLVGPVVDQTAPAPSDASAEASDAAPAALPTPTAAASADQFAGAVLAGCRQGECTWEKVLSTDTLRTLPEGTMKVRRAWQGTSRHPDGNLPDVWRPDLAIDWDRQVVETYVFCSTSLPGIAFQDHGDSGNWQWIAHRLDLFNLGGYNEPSARLYLKVCHQLDLDGPGTPDRLRQLGYEEGTPSGQMNLANPLHLAQSPAGESEDQ